MNKLQQLKERLESVINENARQVYRDSMKPKLLSHEFTEEAVSNSPALFNFFKDGAVQRNEERGHFYRAGILTDTPSLNREDLTGEATVLLYLGSANALYWKWESFIDIGLERRISSLNRIVNSWVNNSNFPDNIGEFTANQSRILGEAILSDSLSNVDATSGTKFDPESTDFSQFVGNDIFSPS